ncbi:hypothetical protein HaLaN_25176, partial [Haematococcus lacustris]
MATEHDEPQILRTDVHLVHLCLQPVASVGQFYVHHVQTYSKGMPCTRFIVASAPYQTHQLQTTSQRNRAWSSAAEAAQGVEPPKLPPSTAALTGQHKLLWEHARCHPKCAVLAVQHVLRGEFFVHAGCHNNRGSISPCEVPHAAGLDQHFQQARNLRNVELGTDHPASRTGRAWARYPRVTQPCLRPRSGLHIMGSRAELVVAAKPAPLPAVHRSLRSRRPGVRGGAEWLRHAAVQGPSGIGGSDLPPSPHRAVLKKDYAVGYLLLTFLGRSTLVLANLLAAITEDVSTDQQRPSADGQQADTAGLQGGPPGVAALADLPDGRSSPSSTEDMQLMSRLLISMGMLPADALEVMADVDLDSDDRFAQLLQLASAASASQPVNDQPTGSQANPTDSAGASLLGEEQEKGDKTAASVVYKAMLGSGYYALLGTGSPLALDGGGAGGGDHGGGHASGGGNGGGGGGGRSGGKGGKGDGAEQPDGRASGSLSQDAWLPIAMALCMILPPGALLRLVKQLLAAHRRLRSATPLLPLSATPSPIAYQPAAPEPLHQHPPHVNRLQRVADLRNSLLTFAQGHVQPSTAPGASVSHAAHMQSLATAWAGALRFDLLPVPGAAFSSTMLPAASLGELHNSCAHNVQAQDQLCSPLPGSPLEAMLLLSELGETLEAVAASVQQLKLRCAKAEAAAIQLHITVGEDKLVSRALQASSETCFGEAHDLSAPSAPSSQSSTLFMNDPGLLHDFDSEVSDHEELAAQSEPIDGIVREKTTHTPRPAMDDQFFSNDRVIRNNDIQDPKKYAGTRKKVRLDNIKAKTAALAEAEAKAEATAQAAAAAAAEAQAALEAKTAALAEAEAKAEDTAQAAAAVAAASLQ